MKDHSRVIVDESTRVFQPTLACLIGVNEAIVIQQIHYLVRLNKGDKKKFKEGRWWTYDSFSDLKEKFFPFWSERTLQRIVASLDKQGVLFVGRFSPFRKDRRNWYAINYAKVDALLSSHIPDDDNLSLSPTTTDCRDAPRQNDVMLTPRQDGVISTIYKESNTRDSNTLPPSATGSVPDSSFGDELGDGSEEAVV